MSAVEYIPREAALSRQRTIELISHEQGADFVTRLRVVEVSDIEETPASDVIPATHGKWTKERTVAECSSCGRTFPAFLRLYDFCPGCGAHMTLEGSSDGPA